MVMPPCSGQCAGPAVPAGEGPAAGPMAAATRQQCGRWLVQGQNRGSDSAVTRLIRASRLAPGPGLAEAGRQADHLQAGGRRSQHRRVGAAGDAQDREHAAPRATVAGQLQHAAGHLAVEGRGVEVPFAGDGQVGPLQALAQADQAGHEVETGLNACPQGDQASRQPARRAGTGHAGDVDAGLAAVAGRHLGEAPAELRHLRSAWPPSAGRRRQPHRQRAS